MSVIFMDGFDYYYNSGPGGRKWDQGSSGGNSTTGRFGGMYMGTGGNGDFYAGSTITFKNQDGTVRNMDTIVFGFAMNVTSYSGAIDGTEYPSHPFVRIQDLTTVQCSLWIDSSTQYLQVRLGTGEGATPTIVLSTAFAPPLTLWYYLECKVTMGTSGSVELMVDGSSIGSVTGVNLQQSGNPYINRLQFCSYNNYGGGVQAGSWACDDFYVVDCTDGIGSVDYLGEVRIQTKVPDADGYQDDFLRSQGLVNADNVNIIPVSFTDNGYYNYSGTVGAKDLYSIGNFTVSGTIFAVQENISYKKDDVGNRQVALLLRTAAQNYIGPFLEGTEPNTYYHSCFSSYTYAGLIWEKNPQTNAPWALIDLNLTEFGVKVAS